MEIKSKICLIYPDFIKIYTKILLLFGKNKNYNTSKQIINNYCNDSDSDDFIITIKNNTDTIKLNKFNIYNLIINQIISFNLLCTFIYFYNSIDINCLKKNKIPLKKFKKLIITNITDIPTIEKIINSLIFHKINYIIPDFWLKIDKLITKIIKCIPISTNNFCITLPFEYYFGIIYISFNKLLKKYFNNICILQNKPINNLTLPYYSYGIYPPQFIQPPNIPPNIQPPPNIPPNIQPPPNIPPPPHVQVQTQETQTQETQTQKTQTHVQIHQRPQPLKGICEEIVESLSLLRDRIFICNEYTKKLEDTVFILVDKLKNVKKNLERRGITC